MYIIRVVKFNLILCCLLIIIRQKAKKKSLNELKETNKKYTLYLINAKMLSS